MHAHAEQKVKAEVKAEAKEAKDAPIKTPFQIIYEAAKRKDEAAIKAVLGHVCINISNGFDTPIGLLAFEGDVEAVNFLRRKFNASSLLAINGYARANNKDQYQKLLAEALPTEKFLFFKEIIIGLARSNHVEQVNELLATIAEPDEYLEALRYAAHGYARAGNQIEAYNLLQLYLPKKAEEDAKLIKHLLLDLLEEQKAAKEEKVDPKKEIVSEVEYEFLTCIADGFSDDGHFEAIKKLLQRNFNDEQRHILLQGIIYRLAAAGEIDQANYFISTADAADQPILHEAKLRGLAHGGYSPDEANVDNPIFLFSITYGHALRGEIGRIKKLAVDPEDLESIESVILGYFHGHHLMQILELVGVLPAEERLKLIKDAFDNYINHGRVAEASYLYSLLEIPREKVTLLQTITEVILATNPNEYDVLKFLAACHPDTREAIAIVITPNKPIPAQEAKQEHKQEAKEEKKSDQAKEAKEMLATPLHLAKKATRITEVMYERGFTFQQAYQWVNRDAQGLALHKDTFQRRLPSLLFPRVASYLSVTPLKETENIMKLFLQKTRPNKVKNEEKKAAPAAAAKTPTNT